ncbi:hypothetical protein [Sinomonas sp. G460-2]
MASKQKHDQGYKKRRAQALARLLASQNRRHIGKSIHDLVKRGRV